MWIEDVQVYPNIADKSARVKVRMGNATGTAGQGTLTIGQQSQPVAWDKQGAAAELDVALGTEAKPWDEFHPALQKLSVQLKGAPGR